MNGVGTYVELISQKLCTGNQRGLVRTTRLIIQLAVPVLRNDGMAHREQSQEFVHDLPLPHAVCLRREVTKRILRAAEERRHLRERPPAVLPVLALPALALLDDIRVRDTRNRAEPKFHLVARQRPRLVAEHVLDLPELLHERRCPAQCRGVRLRVVHIQVRVDELGLLVLDDLHGDDE